MSFITRSSTLLVAVILNLALAHNVYSLNQDWTRPNDIQIESRDITIDRRNCTYSTASVLIPENPGKGNVVHQTMCVYNAKNYYIALYVGNFNRYYWAIKLPGTLHFVHLSDFLPGSNLSVNASNDRLSFLGFDTLGGQSVLSTIDNPLDQLQVLDRSETGEVIAYSIKTSGIKKWLGFREAGFNDLSYMQVNNVVYSLNGRYALAWTDYKGHVTIDFETSTVKIVSDVGGVWTNGPYNPTAGAITNDGKYSFIQGGPNVIYDNGCGIEVNEDDLSKERDFKKYNVQCEITEYHTPEKAGFYGRAFDYRWIGNEEGLQFAYDPIPPSPESASPKLITYRLDKPVRSQFDYLALGDSYSSGEGHVLDGTSSYTDETKGIGGCHISLNSYPFLLRNQLAIQSHKMQSVACSGAKVSEDYYADMTQYLGQGKRLEALSTSDREERKEDALEKFTPGIVPQLEFVAKYKPATITLTGGGNDANFGPILAHCAGVSDWRDRYTCGYARKGSALHRQLANTISRRYDATRNLIKKIKEVSPETTIHIIGYPSFIADNGTCKDAAMLSFSERKMINQAVSYMNSTLKAAAMTEGAHYKDTQAALTGGRICETDAHHVTTLSDIDGFFDGSRRVEAFHPNASGHAKMAEAILGQAFTVNANDNPQSNVATPVVPEFFKAKKVSTKPGQLTKEQKLSIRKAVKLILKSFRAKSVVIISINGKTLKQVKASNQPVNVSLPRSTEDGYQVLSALGVDANGKALETYQYVEVESGLKKDSDNDGVINSKDTCKYVPQWRDEKSRRVICGS